MSTNHLPLSPIPNLRIIELGVSHESILQAFFEANPEYFVTVTGELPRPSEAREEIAGDLPSGASFRKKWVLGYLDSTGALVAMAQIVSDLHAEGVWHIGLFQIASSRHGNGEAQTLYRGLESWAESNGAEWFRLGVVLGNERAEHFWERMGFIETRMRYGITMGQLTNTIRYMVKPLHGKPICQYLQLVERDRPDPPDSF